MIDEKNILDFDSASALKALDEIEAMGTLLTAFGSSTKKDAISPEKMINLCKNLGRLINDNIETIKTLVQIGDYSVGLAKEESIIKANKEKLEKAKEMAKKAKKGSTNRVTKKKDI